MIFLVIFKSISVFILGLIFGSFANVLVDRGEKKERLTGRSKCDFCGEKIAWYDNIPLVSYFYLKGKCRNCGKKISWYYPAVELLFGFGFLLISWRANFLFGYVDFGDLVTTCFYLGIGFILLTILVWDLKYMIIPDGLVVGGLVLAIIYFGYQYLISPDYLMNVDTDLTGNFLGGILVGGFFYLMFQMSKGRWIGGGDIKLGFLVGFLVGWKMSYFLLLFAYVLGAFPAIYLLISGKATPKTRIPFGPFLIIATLIIMLWEKDLTVLLKQIF